MAKHGNAERKLKHITSNTSPPYRNDLSNWVMDGGCKCHMTPILSDFLPNTFVHENKLVEVADNSSIPAESSGNIHLHVFKESHEKFILTLQNILYVPILSR